MNILESIIKMVLFMQKWINFLCFLIWCGNQSDSLMLMIQDWFLTIVYHLTPATLANSEGVDGKSKNIFKQMYLCFYLIFWSIFIFIKISILLSPLIRMLYTLWITLENLVKQALSSNLREKAYRFHFWSFEQKLSWS